MCAGFHQSTETQGLLLEVSSQAQEKERYRLRLRCIQYLVNSSWIWCGFQYCACLIFLLFFYSMDGWQGLSIFSWICDQFFPWKVCFISMEGLLLTHCYKYYIIVMFWLHRILGSWQYCGSIDIELCKFLIITMNSNFNRSSNSRPSYWWNLNDLRRLPFNYK